MGMFELLAPVYNPAMRLFGADFAELAKLLELRTGDLAVDVGGGTGLGARSATSVADCRALVVDYSQAMLRRAPCGGSIACVRADAGHLPLADASADGALCLDALHHFAHPDAALREIVRVLRPGRRAALLELDISRLPIKVLAAVERLAGEPGTFWNAPQLVDMVRVAGLREVSLRSQGFGIVLIAERPTVM